MASVEVKKACLDDRKAEYEQLKNELEQIEFKYHKVEFEEDMYYTLKDKCSMRYKEVFTDKHDTFEKKLKELEEIKNSQKLKLEIVEKEIEYIENLLK